METSIASAFDDFPTRLFSPETMIEILKAQPLPEPHPAETSLFERQDRVPGITSKKLAATAAVLVGAGGLNSWCGAALLRMGLGSLTVIDPDTVERSNLTRQLYFGNDIGKFKAACLAHNLMDHSVNSAQIIGIPLRFEEAVENYLFPADILLVGVDNNACRRSASLFARKQRIPAIFSMLSIDGLRCHVFFQGANTNDACLWCALPNLDIEKAMPCAAAFIPACFLATAYTVFFALRCLMGWPQGSEPFNWREADLSSMGLERAGFIRQSPNCPVCKGL